MIAQFVVFVIVLVCVIGGLMLGPMAEPSLPLQRFLPPKTVHLRPILRRFDVAAAPKRGVAVTFSDEIGVRVIDKRGRIRDRVGLINDVKRPRVRRAPGDTYPVATSSIPSAPATG